MRKKGQTRQEMDRDERRTSERRKEYREKRVRKYINEWRKTERRGEERK